MSDLDELLAYWRAADRLFQNHEEPRGGAVVSDRRYPRIHEANYALVQTAEPVHLDEIDGVLGPAARAAGAPFDHVVVLTVEEQTELIAEASTRGERLSFDQVMRWSDRPPDVDPRVAAIDDPDEAFWTAFRDSARVFGVEDEATGRGARATYLLTEPDGPAVGIYRRAGFGTVTRIGSWVSEPHKMS